ncbi:transferase [Pseudomonas aeruginosa]|nr:transferase [Pseudomonas aeruginosa]
MKRIIILGAGGLGRQVLAQLQVDYGHGIDWVIGGFLDERGPDAVAESLYTRWLGYPENFVAEPDQLFVAAVGDRSVARSRSHACWRRAPSSSLSRTAQPWRADQLRPDLLRLRREQRRGLPYRRLRFHRPANHARPRRGHRRLCHIGPRCLLAGYVKVGDRAVINSGAMIARDVSIGEDAVVGMGAVVFKDVAAGQTVVGNPAQVIFSK